MNNTNLNTYYTWDSKTHKYTGSINSEKCPENATKQDITGLLNPVWNGTEWVGDSIDDYINELKKQKQSDDDQKDKVQSDMFMKVLELTLEVKKLKGDTNV